MSEANLKKQYERFLLEQFMDAAKLTGEIVDEDGEAPDFIVRFAGELVGIEVTELFVSNDGRQDTLQGQESISQRIVLNAQRLYKASGAQHAYVSVHFATRFDLRILHRDQTASTLAAFVKAQRLSPGQYFQWSTDHVSNPLPAAIIHVLMLGVPTPEMAHWSSSRAGWVAPITEQVLQARIDEKALLLPKYSRRVATIWLLLVADGSKPSQFFDPPSSRIASAISSPFARTFCFGRMRGTVVELGASQ